MTIKITLIAKRPYEFKGKKGITYGGFLEKELDGKKYLLFTSPNSKEYDIFPEARAGKKFDPNNFQEIEVYDHFDMFSGKSKWKDVPDDRPGPD